MEQYKYPQEVYRRRNIGNGDWPLLVSIGILSPLRWLLYSGYRLCEVLLLCCYARLWYRCFNLDLSGIIRKSILFRPFLSFTYSLLLAVPMSSVFKQQPFVERHICSPIGVALVRHARNALFCSRAYTRVCWILLMLRDETEHCFSAEIRIQLGISSVLHRPMHLKVSASSMIYLYWAYRVPQRRLLVLASVLEGWKVRHFVWSAAD